MKTALTVLVFCFIILCSGCFLRFRSQELNLDTGSGPHPDSQIIKTTNSETKGGE